MSELALIPDSRSENLLYACAFQPVLPVLSGAAMVLAQVVPRQTSVERRAERIVRQVGPHVEADMQAYWRGVNAIIAAAVPQATAEHQTFYVE